MQGSIAYFGTYSIDDKDGTLITFHIEGSSFPNWEDAEEKRVLKVSGNEMDYMNPTISTGAGVARLNSEHPEKNVLLARSDTLPLVFVRC